MINWISSVLKKLKKGAQGVDGKILSAGWIHKDGENTNEYFILLSLQGIELEMENVMVWNYDLVGVYSEGFAANQWYTFANTIIVLKPNSNSPQVWNILFFDKFRVKFANNLLLLFISNKVLINSNIRFRDRLQQAK